MVKVLSGVVPGRSGRKVEPVTTYRTGLYVRFLPGDLLWFLTTRDRRFGLTPSFFKFLGRDLHYLVTSLSDPGPILSYVAENVMAVLSPSQRAFRFRMNAGSRQR